MRLAAGAGATVLGVLALMVEPLPDCLEWCAIEVVVLVAFMPLVGWPAVVPDRWIGRGDAPLVSAFVVTALALSVALGGAAIFRIIAWTAAGTLLVHWMVWRTIIRRRAADAALERA